MQLLFGPKKTVTTVLFAAGGSTLLAVTSDLKVRVWDLTAGRVRRSLDRAPSEWERAVALSPDGTTLATGDRGGVRLWDVAGGTVTRVLRGPYESGFASAVTFTPDGRQVVAGGFVDKGGQARGSQRLYAWDAATGWPRATWGAHAGAVLRLAVAPSGRRLAAQSATALTVWDAAARREVLTRPAGARHDTAVLLYSPDGARLVHGTGAALFVLDTAALADVAALEQGGKALQAAAFSPNGRLLAAVANGAVVTLWDATTWQVRQEFAWRTGKLKCVAFAPDGLRLAAGGEQGQVVVWDVEG